MKVQWCQFGLMFAYIVTICTSSPLDIDHKASMHLLYPPSTANLIVDFFQTYKHIKQLTLFMCNDNAMYLTTTTTTSPYPMVQHHSNWRRKRVASSSAPPHQMQINKLHNQKLESHENRLLNFQQIIKFLMASGNFFIKGVGNIDATTFTTTTTTTSGNYDNGNTTTANNRTEYDKMNFINVYNIPDMLKSGDFKQGVVLDLRCHRSKYILQQVNQSFRAKQKN